MKAYPRGGRPHKPEKVKIAEKIIGSVVIGTTILVSPVAGTALLFLGVGTAGYFFRKGEFNREVKRLQKNGYIALTKTKKGWLVRVTKKGWRKQKLIEIQNLTLLSPKTWDGKWRLFIFDIPEKYRYERDALRNRLKKLGLYNIQRSVLAYPHDCRKELELIAEYYGLNEYATYVETNSIDIEKELRRHFRV